MCPLAVRKIMLNTAFEVSRKSVTCKSDENENFLTNVILELLFPFVLLYCSSLREETDLLHI